MGRESWGARLLSEFPWYGLFEFPKSIYFPTPFARATEGLSYTRSLTWKKHAIGLVSMHCLYFTLKNSPFPSEQDHPFLFWLQIGMAREESGGRVISYQHPRVLWTAHQMKVFGLNCLFTLITNPTQCYPFGLILPCALVWMNNNANHDDNHNEYVMLLIILIGLYTHRVVTCDDDNTLTLLLLSLYSIVYIDIHI